MQDCSISSGLRIEILQSCTKPSKWCGRIMILPLQWRYNERDGISNHQPHDCLFRRRSKKTSKLRVTGLCEGNSPVTVGFPAQRGVSNAENVSNWWRHHDIANIVTADDLATWGIHIITRHCQYHDCCRRGISSHGTDIFLPEYSSVSIDSVQLWVFDFHRGCKWMLFAYAYDWDEGLHFNQILIWRSIDTRVLSLTFHH